MEWWGEENVIFSVRLQSGTVLMIAWRDNESIELDGSTYVLCSSVFTINVKVINFVKVWETQRRWRGQGGRGV